MTRTLVTGGTGFLGRHLVAQLRERGEPLRVLARPTSDVRGVEGEGVEIVRGDVTSRDDLERALDGVQRVFHCAAEVRDGQDPARYQAVNFHAVETLLDLAQRLGVERVVHTSSYFAIGRSGPPRMPESHEADEYWTHDPGDMHDAHEQSKYDGEHALNQHVSRSEPVLCLDPTMMYGPELRPVASPDALSPGNRIVRMLCEHAAGRYPGIPGDGTQRWNLVHVEDVARAHVTVMAAADESGRWPPPRWKHWHYIVGGENIAVNDLFALFGALAGAPEPAHVPERKGLGRLLGRLLGAGERGRSPERFAMDLHHWAYTSEMAAHDFGYKGRPVREGLEQTVSWLREEGLLR